MSPRDVHVVDAVRTPVGRHNGALAPARPDDLAAHVIRGLLVRAPGLDHSRIEDVCFVHANGAGEEHQPRAGQGRQVVHRCGRTGEAFAAQGLGCVAEWPGFDPAILNPQGGAIALGHPLGASGARLAGTVAHQLSRKGSGGGVAALCIGVGQGLALVLERWSQARAHQDKGVRPPWPSHSTT